MGEKNIKDWRITHQFIEYIDSTPNEGYVLRILQAYRDNCNSKFSTESDGTCNDTMLDMMNKNQDERAKLLDEAIQIIINNK